ncbi:MAG: sensor histidine kinase [Alphaproteobacteria bacterium]|jgi:hypothetical protein|nr:sensor histidine kinase [Alphaproteobacteria bacterium]
MLQGWVILIVALAYLGVLFAIAAWGDRRARSGNSLIANPYIYTLSIAVYCTAWTFYGSVGRAATSGVGFLPIYLGPTLMAVLWWFVLRKIIRISKAHRITTIADFVSSRYGKDPVLGGLVTVIAVVGIMPYISLQLKAISTSFTILLQYPDIIMPSELGAVSFVSDTAFYVALMLAAFTILFGTRSIDATEHHEGMVAAVAFESVVKLVAFLAVGIFVTYGLYDGFGDIFQRAHELPDLAHLFTLGGDNLGYGSWASLMLLSMMAIMFLPRQFQVTVIENKSEDHLRTATWLFPLYLLAINVFVLPIAFGGLLHFPDGSVDADTFVLTLPMAERREGLALLVFIGGLSAATAMVIVATIALSTMVCNDLVMPLVLRFRGLGIIDRIRVRSLLLGIRRSAIVAILLLGYSYYRLVGESYALVAIGLVSFAAAAQFAPVILGGLYWTGGSRRGALAGLSGGFAVWAYTLVLPSFTLSGWLPESFIDLGPFGLTLLRPYEMFGLSGFDIYSHSVFWSLLTNVGLFVGVSLADRQTALERTQAALFVDVFRYSGEVTGPQFWRGTASLPDLRALVARFVGRRRADSQFAEYAEARGIELAGMEEASPGLVNFAERLLAGSIGAASARVMVSSVVKEEPLGIGEVMEILTETSQVIEHSRQLELKSAQLERATAELREANQRLTELDRMKDNFLSAVTHELRTPLTSIRSFSEILYDNPDIETTQRGEFLGIIVGETERLTRLINEVLDLARLEADEADWRLEEFDLATVLRDALAATGQLFVERAVVLEVEMPDSAPPVLIDRDRVMQVLINLLSNAAKFAPSDGGRVAVGLEAERTGLKVAVQDNGPGIEKQDLTLIFEKFRQAGDTLTEQSMGSGLGLTICREIVEYFGGRIWAESTPGEGATFCFTIPYAECLAEARS